MAEVGFIGLGTLGSVVAGNLLDAGHAVRVHNRTRAKADPLLARGARWAERPADAVVAGGIVATMLWDDASVEAVVRDGDFLSRLGPDGIHVSMSTITPAGSRALAALHAGHGSWLVEAPVFGVPAAAATRALAVPLAGPAAAKARVRPLLEDMGASTVFDFGEAIGAATAVKLAGNLLIISAAASLTEALALVRGEGADPQAVVDMLTATLFPSPIYRNYGRGIADGTATINGSTSPIPAKDLALFRRTAAAAGAASPIAELLLSLRDG